jgi:hypothetical protein
MDPQIVNIVKYLIRETPMGHLQSLLENLKVIVGFEVFDSSDILKEISNYEQDHLKQLNVADELVLISKYNQDSDGYFHDNHKGLKLMVDPLSENIQKIEEVEKKEEGFREILYNKFVDYKNKNYKNDITAINGKYLYFIINLFYFIISL